mmetsp:Transcript_22794/g.41911  ORF Transcript_22794/g.41911 Transcript_22794/m.41911 type:complete len:238 (-) Transcript_22794:468-1181(-)
MLWMSVPSTLTMPDPSSSSIVRRSTLNTVDFPLPVRPTMPTLLPGSTLKLTLFSTSGKSSLYLRETLSNSTCPDAGQLLSRLSSAGRLLGASSSVSSVVNTTRWYELKLVSVSATVRTVQLRSPVTARACVTDTAALAAPHELGPTKPVANNPSTPELNTTTLPSNSIRNENHLSTPFIAYVTAVLPSMAAMARASILSSSRSCRMLTTPSAATPCSAYTGERAKASKRFISRATGK